MKMQSGMDGDFWSNDDTVGATRTITSPNGKTVEVSGGTYGWSIDEETEGTESDQQYQEWRVATREPAYAQTAASHSAQDWGTTFIEVIFLPAYVVYRGRICCVQADVGHRAAHTGPGDSVRGILYTLYGKKCYPGREKEPGDRGEPIYRTPVAYWMPFTWQGHGFP